MHELGIKSRLSAEVWYRAIVLRQRVQHCRAYAAEEAVLAIASRCHDSWTAKVASKMAEWRLRPPDMGAQNASDAANERRLRDYSRRVVRPAMQAAEMKNWTASTKNLDYWERYDADAWTVCQLADHIQEPAPLRSWAQLKLQGRFRHLFEPTRQQHLLDAIQARVDAYWERVE